jgi:hypothetical protein
MGRLLSRGLRWCWSPIGKLRRSCICYDRCRRWLVCGQPWIGKLGRLADLGCNVFAGSPTDFGKFIADETEKWAKLIKFAGIKPE